MAIGRRDVLRLGALAVPSTALEGCAPSLARTGIPAPLPTIELEATLASLDRVVRAIEATPADPRRFGASPSPGDTARGHDLVAKSLATMHVIATFRELPADAQVHPEVQRRMWRALPDISGATMANLDFLDGLSHEARRKIDGRLSTDAALPMRVLEKLDDDAARLGVPLSHRTRLRTLGAHVTWRLKHQGANAVIDEIVAKLDRIGTHRAKDAELERAVAAKVLDARLFGMPVEGQPDAAPPAPDQPGVLRAHFRTTADAVAVQKAACSLDAKITSDGRIRPLDIAGCGTAREGALRGNLRIDRATTGSEWEVHVEIDVPTDATSEGIEELKTALRDTAGELRRRSLAVAPSSSPSSVAPTSPSSDPPRVTMENRSRSSTRALIVAGIAWGVALGFGIPGIVLVAQNDIGGAFLLTPASIAAVTGIVALIAAAATAANGD